MAKAGLLAACLGALLLALSTHLGVVSGFVGVVVWAGLWWRLANIAGWLLLIGGLFLQYLGVRRTPGTTPSPSEVEALLDVLAQKGVIRKAEVLEEITRLRGKAMKTR